MHDTSATPVGGCSNAIQVNVGALTVTETATAGTAVDHVSHTGPGAVVVNGNVATVSVTAGTIADPTIVSFLNRTASGLVPLQLCKIAGPGVAAGTAFGFTVTPAPAGCTRVAGPPGRCTLTLAAGTSRVTYTNSRTTSSVCMRSQGYYKNHEDVVAALLGRSSPYVQGGQLLVATGGFDVAVGRGRGATSTHFDGTPTAEEIDEILGSSTGGDATLAALRQLIAAELGAIAGGALPAQVGADVAPLQGLVAGGVTDGEREAALDAADRLERFIDERECDD